LNIPISNRLIHFHPQPYLLSITVHAQARKLQWKGAPPSARNTFRHYTQVEDLSERLAEIQLENKSLRQIVSGLQNFASRAATAGEQSLRLAASRHQAATRQVSGTNSPRTLASPPITEAIVQQKLESFSESPEAEEGEVAPGEEWKHIALRRVFTGVLSVVLNKATDLKPKMFGTRDPYAVLRMRSASDMKVWKSRAKSSTRNPTWDEQTSFLVQVCPALFTRPSPSKGSTAHL
jgi:hypothetical protein